MQFIPALLISFVAAISEADMPAGDMLTEDPYTEGFEDGYDAAMDDADYQDGYEIGYDDGMYEAVFYGDELEYSDESTETEWCDEWDECSDDWHLVCSADHDFAGDGCDWYAENADWGCEGTWDTDCFSGIECEGCSGACDYRVEHFDSDGDGCDVYADGYFCTFDGEWDTDCFFAADCDGCYVCIEGQDEYGDGCDWYADNVDGCGVYDTECFVSSDSCDACM